LKPGENPRLFFLPGKKENATVLQAVSKIRAALSARDVNNAHLNSYLFHENRIYATDTRITASVPYKHGLERLVPGAELEALLARLPPDFKLTSDDDSISLRAGRLHGTIRTLPPEIAHMALPGDEWSDPPATLVDALKRARPFVAENAAQPYSTCACLRTGCILATTNVALAEVECPGLQTDSDILLPYWTVDFIIKAAGALKKIILQAHYAAFMWDDGLWLRTQLIIGAFPDLVKTLLGEQHETPITISDDWRAAYRTVTELSENIITVQRDKIIGGKGHSRVEYEVDPIEMVEPVHFRPDFLLPVITLATAWNPGAYPKPVPFVGPGIRGLIVGRSA
jgi:hypothetical protein